MSDRPNELVLDRDAPCQERDHDLVQAGGDAAAEEELLLRLLAVAAGDHTSLGRDAVGLLGQDRLVAVVLDLVDRRP